MNGSSLLLLTALLLVAFSCTPTRKTADRPKPEPPDQKSRVYNPETGEYEPVRNPQALVDTVEWKTDATASEPITTVKRKAERKDVYTVSLLLPLRADAYQQISQRFNARDRRFIHFYAGFRLGLKALKSEGVQLKAHVFDTKSNKHSMEGILKREEIKQSDLIIGPYDREHIQQAAGFAHQAQIPLVSPWIPGFRLSTQSPYIVQLTPGLSAHARAIMQYINTRFSDRKIYLVARNTAREINRLTLFEEAYNTLEDKQLTRPPERLIIEDNTIDLSETDLAAVLPMENPDDDDEEQDAEVEWDSFVFVVPYFSRRNEDFVNNLLRKLHADKQENTICVFGLPQWYQFTKLNPDYLEGLDTHISTVHYEDRSKPSVRAFEKKFYNTYQTIPESSAYQGFEVITYFGRLLSKYGTGFIEYYPENKAYQLNYGFDLKPVYRDMRPDTRSRDIIHYENAWIRMLKFDDQYFQLVNE